jgi:hypothetical protein
MSGTPNPHELDTHSTATSTMARAPWQLGESRAQFFVRTVSGLVDLAPTVEANHPRRIVEGAEHQRDAAVRFEVRYRLHAATRQVEPGDAVRTQDPEGVEPAGRDVDVGRRVGGAVATKKTGCSSIQEMNSPGIFSNVCAMMLFLSS